MAQISTEAGDPMKKLRARGIAILAVAVGLGLSGCGSDDKKVEATTSSPTSGSASEAPPSREAAKPNATIQDYVKQNGISETPIHRGDPGSPEINLPVPPGWEDVPPPNPNFWGTMKFTGDPALADSPPTINALLGKLQGNVDRAKILEFAPGEMKNLPGYEGDGVGSASQLGGFEAWQIVGTYMMGGAKRAVAQKTVVIPAADGLFVLQLNADGTEDQMGVLAEATNIIDEQTTIVPAP
jgi:Probable lipoprotein LpqN